MAQAVHGCQWSCMDQFHLLNLEEIFVKKALNFVAVLLALFVSQANASFIGSYDFANWTKSVNGGSIITSQALDSLLMVSSNNGGGNRHQDFTVTAVTSGLVTFNWDYLTLDTSKKQKPKYDPFGWLLNGTFNQLTDNKDSIVQSGLFSFAVTAGDIFGFRASSTNSRNGSAMTLITNFSGPLKLEMPPASVPLPSAFWLMLVPMLTFLKNRKAIAV